MDKSADHKVDEATGCWNWQRKLDHYGYGALRITRGSYIKAHRAYYERYRGPIPEGLTIDHLCHNRRCVNPEHLEAVSHAVNCQRRKDARLTADQARAIREATGTQLEVAERYGVHQTTVSQIRLGKTWANA